MPVCFMAHSGDGVACFCMSLLLLVQLLWIFVFFIYQLKNEFAQLLLVQLTPSKAAMYLHTPSNHILRLILKVVQIVFVHLYSFEFS